MAHGSRERGQAIETAMSEWLGAQGLELLDRNFTRRFGEIDLIMREPDTGLIVFIEVRFREDDRFNRALESVDARKQAKLLRTASAWLQKYADDRTRARFDVIAVNPDSGQPRQPALPGEVQPVSWQGLSILWIRDAVQPA